MYHQGPRHTVRPAYGYAGFFTPAAGWFKSPFGDIFYYDDGDPVIKLVFSASSATLGTLQYQSSAWRSARDNIWNSRWPRVTKEALDYAIALQAQAAKAEQKEIPAPAPAPATPKRRTTPPAYTAPPPAYTALATTTKKKKRGAASASAESPSDLMKQPWFWPAAVVGGASIIGILVLLLRPKG